MGFLISTTVVTVTSIAFGWVVRAPKRQADLLGVMARFPSRLVAVFITVSSVALGSFAITTPHTLPVAAHFQLH